MSVFEMFITICFNLLKNNESQPIQMSDMEQSAKSIEEEMREIEAELAKFDGTIEKSINKPMLDDMEELI